MEISKRRLQKVNIVLTALLLSAMMPFSVFAITSAPKINLGHPPAPPTIVTVEPGTFVAKLKTDPAIIFVNDPKIKSYSQVFLDTQSNYFKSIYEINSDYTLADFKTVYGKYLVYAEKEKAIKSGAVTVNDPGFTTNSGDISRTWGLSKADFTEAWTKTTGSSNVVVAVIDTGIDATHEDLSSGQIAAGFDFINRQAIDFGKNSDDNGHGTLISGVIAATPNNFRGIVGGAWNATLMPLKALDSKGAGNSADLAAAIVYAADHNANIINMSLGGTGFGNDTTLLNAISYAYNKGVVLVAAAGNDVATTGGNLDVNAVFPVCDDGGQNMVIGVAATDYNDQKADFSNYGKACVDISAPGKRILTTLGQDATGIAAGTPSNSYAFASGTSLATPFVTAEAVLIKAYYPNSTNKQIRDRIIKSADVIDAANLTQCNNGPCFGMIGSGRINAFKALDENLLPKALVDGDLVQGDQIGTIYSISGGQKHPVSNFVFNERFASQPVTKVQQSLLDALPLGAYALPYDNTLVRAASSFTVYQILGGIKRPVTYQVFLQRQFTFPQVNVLTDEEINSWVTGTFLPPTDGILVRGAQTPTVYWTIDGLLHPMNRGFFVYKGLNIFPQMIMSENDLRSYAKGNAYVR